MTVPPLRIPRVTWFIICLLALAGITSAAPPHRPAWLESTAYRIPRDTTSEESGYFSLVAGRDGRLYIGAAKYRFNAYLVEFDPALQTMRVVVDGHDAIRRAGLLGKGFTHPTGFAAQAKIHTRNNVGDSGRIYFGTKQGYPTKDESRDDYPGGYPMWYDPATGHTRVYAIPVARQGVISVTPDESRGLAYISTCSDERPIESTHFMVLNLATGNYRDLIDCRHMYAFIVLDHKGRAYHPIVGGDIARYDPDAEKLEQLKQTIDGRPPQEYAKHSPAWLLAHPQSHPINWDVSPDRRKLYAVAMSGNELFEYDLTTGGDGAAMAGRSRGKLIGDATATDCRAMCVGPDGTVWMGVAATFGDKGQFLHLVSCQPGDAAPRDHGPIAISNPDYTKPTDALGKPMSHQHGVYRAADGRLVPRYTIMAIAATEDGSVYLTTIYPFTLHKIPAEARPGVGPALPANEPPRAPTPSTNPTHADAHRPAPPALSGTPPALPSAAPSKKKIAVITTAWYHNSHADVIAGRLLDGYTLDNLGPRPNLTLASLYTDQVPANDVSRALSRQHGFPIFDRVDKALTLGGDKLAVDGVLLIAEHGQYPESDTGQIIYPKRRLFDEVVRVFDRSGRVVPVFFDKHLADHWPDAKHIHDTAKARQIPLMAGSSVPITWRYPAVDVMRDAEVKEIVAVSFHRLDTYGFHALELVQCLAERRRGGETGVAKARTLSGDAVWQAGRDGEYDRTLLDATLARLLERPLPAGRTIEQLERKPVLFSIEYRDGLKAHIFTMNSVISEWAAAWRYKDGGTAAMASYTQEWRPLGHFGVLTQHIESFLHSGQSHWPAERTLMTSGMLDALLVSHRDGGKLVDTPQLDLRYQSRFNWTQPPPPPPNRPLSGR